MIIMLIYFVSLCAGLFCRITIMEKHLDFKCTLVIMFMYMYQYATAMMVNIKKYYSNHELLNTNSMLLSVLATKPSESS